ncbi:MAG: pyruvate ferredoxin oxidoreductase [Halodesulfurarchaeum sp.]
MPKETMLKGDKAVAHGVKAIQPDVVSAYPITPQTGIVERVSQFKADGELEGEFLKVDSEFNACSTALGALAAGARAFSATSSQGLKLMSEPLFTASGMRLPLVMAVANRSLSAPLSIWGDHTDTFAERDGGMIQIYAEDVQEAVDNLLMAYKVAEDPDISLPALSTMDGFILTHVKEPVELYTESEVADFLPKRDPNFTLDPNDPVTMGAYARPEHWTETRYAVQDALFRSKDTIDEVVHDFADQFGREYGLEYRGMVDVYGPDDADVAIVTIGSLVGTVRDVLEEYEAAGLSVKLVKVRVYRPFPVDELRAALEGVEAAAVLEKDVSLGFQGGLVTDLKAGLYNSDVNPQLRSFIVGLAGRDVQKREIREIIDEMAGLVEEPVSGTVAFEDEESWPQLRDDILPEEVSSR